MTNITFVKTRYDYPPYTDFFRLVELAGFPTIYVDELDVSKPGVFIVSPMNGEWRPHIDNQSSKERNAHLILWNIERPAGSAGAVGKYGQDNRDLIYRRQLDEVWVSDRRLAEETTLRFVVLGSHPGLGNPGTKKKYDIVHMSYDGVPRRQTIYKQLSNVAPNCWPPIRDEVLQESRMAISIHQDAHPFIEPLRFALFAAYRIPIISETIYDAYPYGDDMIVFSGYDRIVERVHQCLQVDYDQYRIMAQKTWDRMCVQLEFGKMVREAVAQSVGEWR